MSESQPEKIPILLLKTKSAPKDTYEEYLSSLDNHHYAPLFVPVLEHRFDQQVLNQLRKQILNNSFASDRNGNRTNYGAIIFTSQRAVEAFTQVVEEIRKSGSCTVDGVLPKTLFLYAVGPATARGLRALNLNCPVLGEETGNGEALAAYILQHYNSIHPGVEKPRILFLVGDKRRDIIPKTLQSEQLGSERRLIVNEVVVYETGEMQSFKTDFSELWQKHASQGLKKQWVVVFSPTGCQAMLESSGLLDAETGKVKSAVVPRNVFIATIGPTTRTYLIEEFGFTPDVCAEKPSPEGVAAGIIAYMDKHGW